MEALNQLAPIAILIVAFYFLLIRPQQQRQKQHRELMAALAEGDRVVTIGGVFGTVRSLDEERVGVEIASGVIVEFARSAIAKKLEDE